ncbi:mitochondrial ribosome-associated GTPase 1-like isoform X2 [Asterias rubens]|uniref:mitochondrial ribosome-associated GTPase 1-like isoform X2 n=1 Tax=Asterias rubens TaxID=7604 RepID=UPI001454F86A|nr:mitochondrial ribosome-associated GTPase 1-like isoform X2 [Asterias rubens]
MAGQGARQGQRIFRDFFTFGSKDLTHWFPSHMARGMKKMRNALRSVDCIIEVHDARIPFSGRNPIFGDVLDVRPHLLILNKKDVADMTPQETSKVRNHLKEEGVQDVLYTECLTQNSPSVKNIIPRVIELIENSERYNRVEAEEYTVIVIGVPNVGKSSLINAMRRIHLKKGKATPVGIQPGVTRSLMHKIQECFKITKLARTSLQTISCTTSINTTTTDTLIFMIWWLLMIIFWRSWSVLPRNSTRPHASKLWTEQLS